MPSHFLCLCWFTLCIDWVNSLCPCDPTWQHKYGLNGSSNGFMPESIEQLPEPMLTSHYWSFVAITWEHSTAMKKLVCFMTLGNIFSKLLPHLTQVNQFTKKYFAPCNTTENCFQECIILSSNAQYVTCIFRMGNYSKLTFWPLGELCSNLKNMIFKLIKNNRLTTHCELLLRWMPQNIVYRQSTFVQVMAWCRQATSLPEPMLTQINVPMWCY